MIFVNSVFLIIFVPFVTTIPQIFTDSYTFCEYKLGDKAIAFPDKLWTINTKDFTINFSLCKSVQSSCQSKTSSCLIKKRTNQMIDLGHEYTTADFDESALVSLSGTRCGSKNYSLSIFFQCFDSIKSKPRLGPSDDECTYEVTMMRPDCRPKCTDIVEGAYLLDIRNFPKSIQVESESRKFSLSLCGSNRNCLSDAGACEILKTGVVPLASVASQDLEYDISRNELTARGRYKLDRVVRDVQVLIKCNWEANLANATYKKVPTQGRHYKFELESSFGCVKLPQNCALHGLDNSLYNLSALYKVNGWEVQRVPQGRIFLNICGPLKQLRGICADQHSQVCHLNNNKYLNRGSILSSLKAYDDVIKASFVSGSTCVEKPNFSYRTEIEFRCSATEKGPVFQEYKECVLVVTWETPHACPVDYYTSQTCYMNDRVSNRNLQKLYTQIDKTYPLSPDKKTKLIYNLCGPIHVRCNNFSNASFCLKTEHNEIVIGWEKRELISENGLLRMELQGSVCSNRNSRGEVIVHFVCNFENPSPPPQITVLEDRCKFNVTIFTPLACLSDANFYDCTYNTANLTYDLSPLSHKNKNYVISDQNLEYVFNVCGPIVSDLGVLCRGHTMFCLNNKTEINVRHKYTSLGGVGRPRLLNNTLVLEAEMGSFCEGLGYYKSVIHFECSRTQFAPVFLSKEKCVYNFKWKTPEACPQQKKCVVAASKSDTILDLTNLQKKTVKVNVDDDTNKYEFHLCSDVYTGYSNGIETSGILKREFFSYDQKSYLVLDLQKNCDNSSKVSKVIFKLDCAQTNDDHFEETSFENCTLNMTIHTHTVCLSPKEQVFYSIIEPENSTRIPLETTPLTATAQEIKSDCKVTNGHTGYEFSLNKIKSEKIFFHDKNYTINLDGTLAPCPGILCKNNAQMVAHMCPTVFFNYSRDIVNLKYSTQNQCGSGFNELEVELKCNQTRSGGSILKDEICKSVILYNLPEACFLLKQDIVSGGHTAAIAGSVTAILVVIAAILIYLNRRRCEYMRFVPFYRDKVSVPIYCRDSTL